MISYAKISRILRDRLLAFKANSGSTSQHGKQMLPKLVSKLAYTPQITITFALLNAILPRRT
jgi:hypothetical protein